jgi:Protein of unknown function (DUF2846)
MRPALCSLAFLLLLTLAGCAQPTPFPAVAPLIPQLAPDAARVYFYRDYEPYESLSEPYIYLNGARTGTSIPGGVFYRDVVPGTYLISVDTVGIYWNPFKTVTLRSGDTLYVKIESLRSWESSGGESAYEADTFVVAIIPPEQGARELAGMHYVEREAE